MKDTFLVGGLCVLIVFIGASLYFVKPEGEAAPQQRLGSISYTVLDEGQYAVAADEEKNYRIQNVEGLQTVWTRIYGSDAPAVPVVDFERYEVLVAFDGSHASGGYSVEIRDIVDDELTRTVHITHVRPGDECMVANAITSPYQLVVVPKMRDVLRLTHVDTEEVGACQ